MRTVKLIKNKEFQVRIPLVRNLWGEGHKLYVGVAGNGYLHVWHSKTSKRGKKQLFDAIVTQLNGSKCNKKLNRMLCSVSGTKIKTKSITHNVDFNVILIEFDD